MKRKGKAIAILTGVMGLSVVIVVARLMTKDLLLEKSCLRNLEVPDYETRECAWDSLLDVASERSLPKLLKLFQWNNSEYTQSRAFHLLWAIKNEDTDELGDLILPFLLPNTHIIHASVTAVDEQAGLFLVSAGRQHGVELGMIFTIVRGRRFVAAAKVIKIFPDISGTQILEARSGLKVAAGDQAIGVP